MKAWMISVYQDDDKGNEIVFANNHKEAIYAGYCSNLEFDSYIDVRARREQNFDDMESLSERDLTLEKWRNGWWFEPNGYPDCETATDEEFYKWYDREMV